VGAGTEIGARRLASHGGAARDSGAHREPGAERPPTMVHDDWNPSRPMPLREHPCSTAAGDCSETGLAWELQKNRAIPPPMGSDRGRSLSYKRRTRRRYV